MRQPLLEAFGAITPEQQARIEACAKALEQRRVAAGFVSIPENRRPNEEAGERNCAACDHASDFNDEHRRAYCMHLKRAVSTWHPVLCAAFVPLGRPKRTKFVWQGIVYA
jgi:hypothetical protein